MDPLQSVALLIWIQPAKQQSVVVATAGGLDLATESVVMERIAGHLARERQGAIIVSHRAAPLAICRHVVEILPSPGL